MSLNKLYKYIDSANIAEELNDQKLNQIGADALAGYIRDLESRAEWEERNEKWMKLAAQVVEEKSFPWVNASNVKYPLLTTAAIQFHARAYPALIPSGSIVKGKVVGRDPEGMKAKRAERVGKHMTYQLRDESDEWEEDMDKLLINLPIVGCAFKKTYYSPAEGRNISEFVPAKYLVVNYWAKTLEAAYRKTHILELTENQLIERQRAGIYLDCDLGKPQDSSHDFKGQEDEITGVSAPSTDDDAKPYTICEQHSYLDLDDDGYKEPYIITFEENSGKVLRIVANFEEADVEINEKDEVIKIKSFQHFTKFSFIPNPDGGFYDIGFGILLGPINESANTLINQLTDAGTLSNLQSGFLSRGIKIKRGDASFTPGEWKTVNATGDDLRKAVLPLPVREPSGVLFQLLSQLLESGERLASTTDMMTGENPGQNQAATTTMAVVDQGMKVFTAIYKRIHRALGKEFKKLYKLNEQYLDKEQYINILDPNEEELQEIQQRGDYDPSAVDILPSADPNVLTETQRIAKAQAALEMIPLGVNRSEALKRMLEAQEQPGIEALMQPEEQGEDPQLTFDKQVHEDTMALEKAKLEVKRAELGLKADKEEVEAVNKARTADREDYKAFTESQKKGSFEYGTTSK